MPLPTRSAMLLPILWIAASALPAKETGPVPPTIVQDRTGFARLIGNDGISLQWIDWTVRGHLDAKMVGDTLVLKGSQHAGTGRGRLTLEGRVTRIDAAQFHFHGRIVIADTPDVGRHCVRDGDFTFAITQKRQYWRLQEMERCDGLTDYVDIYF